MAAEFMMISKNDYIMLHHEKNGFVLRKMFIREKKIKISKILIACRKKCKFNKKVLWILESFYICTRSEGLPHIRLPVLFAGK